MSTDFAQMSTDFALISPNQKFLGALATPPLTQVGLKKNRNNAKNENILNSLQAVIHISKRNSVGNSEKVVHPWFNDLLGLIGLPAVSSGSTHWQSAYCCK